MRLAELTVLADAYAAWAREDGEAIDVVEAVGRLVDRLNGASEEIAILATPSRNNRDLSGSKTEFSPVKHIAWDCFHCMASQTLQTHWLTSVGCLHYDNGGGDNAASCWCGWNGPRVPNVGEAVRTWAEHAATALAAAASGGDVKQAPGEAPQSGPNASEGNAQ